MKIVVIGSGLAGLTAGAALAQRGHSVTIFEQYSQPGGVTAPYTADGFRWDLGQLLIEGLGPDEPLGRILAALGIADRVRVRKDDREYVFPDFAIQKPAEYQGLKWRMQQLKGIFPAQADGLERYWSDYVRFTRLMTLGRRMEGRTGLAGLAAKVRLYASLAPFLSRRDWNAQQLMDSYFTDERLKCVFMSILADFFTPPSQFLGLGIFALNPEPSFDCRMPKGLAKNAEQLYHYSVLGGISALVDALVHRIEEGGGRVDVNRPVVRIQVEEKRVTGVIDREGNREPADVVLASGGAQETFFKLVGEQHLPKDYVKVVRELPLMDSVFMLHLGIDFDPAPWVHGVCTYYYGTYDIEGGIRQARSGVYHEGREGFVVHVPTRHSPEMAPPGCHAMTIYTICPDQLAEGSWTSQKEAFADKLLQCAEQRIPGLRQHIRSLHILTPEDFRLRTHTAHHAFGGLAPIQGAERILHFTPVEGLWFIGAQSESGGGVNNVIPAAYRTALRSVQSQ
jgi:phytoene dehydrogenase-like protein